ncbi:docking protein 1b [Syngnathus scovelli]|uniref:docking protein 1b n=1 Tax=Syngnathus scovelli TaxID=161590 RepID=UPI002110AC75|nr:docking protein 1b [Syngnathus scovelli]
MDTHTKEGQLYVQHQKFGKKWKKNWFVLYPASQNGIARLEFFDAAGSGGAAGGNSNEKTRKLDKKIIRLSECISILPALTENCPKDNMAAFCVETNDKTHVFAAEKKAAEEWMNTMCDIAFQGGSGGGGANRNNDGEPQDLKMSENLIYYSREEANQFWVTIQPTEASDRCGLSGNFWLKAENDVLILKEPKTKRDVFVWPYKLLRRYGRDRVMFSFESGRRCDSGPGNFSFDTKQGNEIFVLVDRAIKSQKALAEERPLSCPVDFEPECPPSLWHVRDAAGAAGPASGDSGGSSSCNSWEADGDSGGSKPGSADGVLGKREGGDGGGGARGQACGAVDRHKGRSLPELPASLGSASGADTLPCSTRGRGTAKCPTSPERRAALYSEPADAVRLPPQKADGLYSDPVDSIASALRVPACRLRPLGDESSGGGAQARGGDDQRKARDLYSHVYDRISLELSRQTDVLLLNGDGRRGVNDNMSNPGVLSTPLPSPEHIYDEPEGCAKGGRKRQEEAPGPAGPERDYSTPAHAKSLESHKHWPANRGGRHLPAPRWPKPVASPKPVWCNFARKVPVPSPPGKLGEPDDNVSGGGGGGSNDNNNNNFRGGKQRELYSIVSKPSTSWSNQSKPSALGSPDTIYDNLGNI